MGEDRRGAAPNARRRTRKLAGLAAAVAASVAVCVSAPGLAAAPDDPSKPAAAPPPAAVSPLARARKLAESGDRGGAVTMLEASARANPRDARVHWMLGVLYRQLARPAQAEAALRRATTHDPRHAAAWADLGAVLERRGAHREALTATNRAVALDPDDPGHRADRSIVRYRLGQLDAAVGDAERATKHIAPADPWQLLDHAMMRLTRGNDGDAERALTLLADARRLAPTEEALTLAHGLALLAMGRDRDAVATLDRLQRRNPRHAWSNYGRGLAAWRDGDTARAAQLGAKARSVLPHVFRSSSHNRRQFWSRDDKAFLLWLDGQQVDRPQAHPGLVAALPPRLDRLAVDGEGCDERELKRAMAKLSKPVAACYGDRPGRVSLRFGVEAGRVVRPRLQGVGLGGEADACLLSLLRGSRVAGARGCEVTVTFDRAPAAQARQP